MNPKPKRPLSRAEAISELRRYGIQGSDVYLIDSIPLIEMMWADGKTQDSEVALLDKFFEKHVANINQLARAEVLSVDDAHRFARRFLETRPDPALLKMLRNMVGPVRLHSSNTTLNEMQRRTILGFCLEIGASAKDEHPDGDHERFGAEERTCFEAIFAALW